MFMYFLQSESVTEVLKFFSPAVSAPTLQVVLSMLVFAEQLLKHCILGVLLNSIEHDKWLCNRDVGPLAD